MRLGVLDVGSNTVHLLVVDAHRGGHPTPMSSTKATLRLAEATDSSGKITKRGADKLISTIDEFAKIAISSGCAELMAFATSAVRDARIPRTSCPGCAKRPVSSCRRCVGRTSHG